MSDEFLPVDVAETGAAVDDVRAGKPSASGMQRLALCPGSWMAEKGLPDEGSEAAEAGTRLHRHMELGTLPEDPDEAEAVVWCRAQERVLALTYVNADEVCVREQRWWDVERRFSGQADVVYLNQGVAMVLDYKFGRVPVPVANSNLQLASLALLTFDNVPDVEVVFCGILQPFASRKEPRLVRYRRVDVPQLRRYFYKILNAAEREGARRVPGEEQCRYCRARVSCPECMGLVQHAASMVVDWAEWSQTKKADALRVAGLAKKWAAAVERRAKADLKAGFAIPGFSLSAGKAAFKITDASGAFHKLHDEIGLAAEDFAGCCTVKISDLDKVVHARLVEQAPEGTKQLVKASREWLRAALSDFGATSVSEGSIESDV